MVDFLPIHSASLENIRRESLKDSSIQALQKVIKNGWPETKADVPVQVTPYFDVRDQLSVEEGIVFKGDRCLIPISLRPKVLARLHRSHIGIEGCLRRARESVYWPGMTAALKNYVNRCDVCRTFETSQQKENLHQHKIPDKPWSKVATDLFEFNNRQYLVTVDYYSNFCEVDRMESSTTSKAVISKLKQHFSTTWHPKQWSRTMVPSSTQTNSTDSHVSGSSIMLPQVPDMRSPMAWPKVPSRRSKD